MTLEINGMDEEKYNRAADEQWARQAPWLADYFTEREMRLVANCVVYRDRDPAGLPGHNLMLLVAKMAIYYQWTSGGRLDELIEMSKLAEAEKRTLRIGEEMADTEV